MARVTGTGRKGRITREDVQQWVKNLVAAPPAASSRLGHPSHARDRLSVFGPVETKPLTKIKRLGAKALHRAWLHVPHVTQHDEADVTDLEAFREAQAPAAEKEGFKLTPLAFILKACVVALKQYPEFNASLSPDEQSLVLKRYYHLGIAVDTPQGLVVPVLRDVDQKGVFEIARELAALSQRTRDRTITPDDIQGASFSVSNLGGLGGTAFTPIVNAPQVSYFPGVSRTQIKPVWRENQFEPQKCCRSACRTTTGSLTAPPGLASPEPSRPC